MALVTKNFTLNVTPGAMPPTIHVSEYDIGRTYTITILDENGSAFEIPTGTTAAVEGTLNGTYGFTTSATISNNQVSFTLSESMTAYSGKAWCKIKLTQNSQPIQTCAFVLAVDRAGVEADTVIGASGFEGQIQDAVFDWLDEHKADEFDYVDKSVSGNPLSFNDGAGQNAKSLVVEMQTVWSGSGDPSPTNVRPISGGTGITITAKDKSTTPVGVDYDASWVDKWGLEGTKQSKAWLTEGSLNLLTGELTVNAILDVFDTVRTAGSVTYIESSTYSMSTASTNPSVIGDYVKFNPVKRQVPTSNYYLTSNQAAFGTPMCNLLKHRFSSAEESASWYLNQGSLTLKLPTSLAGTTAATIVDYLISIKDTTPLMIRIPLIEPETYQLTPQEVQTLIGANYITSSLGTMNMTYTARSEKGQEPLVSPTVDIETIEGGNRVTITDVDGEHSFDVMDGNASDIETDTTLTIEGAAADSKATGDALESLGWGATYSPTIDENSGYFNSNGGVSSASATTLEKYTQRFTVGEGEKVTYRLTYPEAQSMWLSYCTYDANGNFIQRIVPANATKQTFSGEIVIPSGVSAIAFSYRTYGDHDFVVNLPNPRTDKTLTIENAPADAKASGDRANEIQDALSDYASVSFTAIAGWRGNSNTIYSPNACYHIDLPVSEGEKYYIKTCTNNTSIKGAALFQDANFSTQREVLAGAASGYIEGYVTIPSGYTYLTVNCAHSESAIIKKYGYKMDAETDLPTYFANEVDSVVAATKGHCTEKSLVFAVITDTHLDDTYGYQVWNDSIKNIAAVNAKYPLDGVIHMGDIINGDAESSISLSQLDKARGDFLSISKKAVFLEGNHDLNSFYNSNADPINEASMFSEMFRFNDTEIVRPDGKLYGYRNYGALGIRVVYLHSSMGDGTHGGRGDNWGYPQDELTWVQNVALDTEYQVLFISHMPMTEGHISTSSSLPTNGNALKTIVSDFIDNGGVVVGLLHGHTHWDDILDNGKFKEVSIGCETYLYTPNDVVGTNIYSYAPATAVKPARMRYTVTQDLWDVVIIRPASRTVKLVRFGAGTDRAFSY